MKKKLTKIDGLFVISPEKRSDERGFFMEIYREDKFADAGIKVEKFVQQNHSCSKKGVIRGLHFQWDKPLGKLIRVINGQAFVVVVDIRKKSSTFGEWFGIELSAQNKKLLYAPAGFASGFAVTGEVAEVEYLYTALYNPNGESNILWNDPKIGIAWPIKNPILSERDQKALTLNEWLKNPASDCL